MSQGYRTGICTKENVKHTGLNVWATGCGDNGPDVDIIAVQGLGAHPYYTWISRSISAEEERPTKRLRFEFLPGRQNHVQADGRSNVTSTASDDAEILWLRDLLPDSVPNARVASYSYESDWRKADVKTSLRKCGEQLLNILRQDRQSKKGCQRPLVFIGHSLGGLVIKQALVLADHGDEFRDIRLSTTGIIFLGTPHQGSEVAVYGVWLAQAIGHDKTLLESLKMNSLTLHDVARDFEASYKNADIVCFYENKDASYGPLRAQMKNFLLVLLEIQRMVQAAPQKIEERYRAQVANTENHSFNVDFSLRGIPVVQRFVGRDEEMARIAQVLLPTLTDRMRRKVFVIHGLGGVGKTQLSVEYTRKYHESYSAVFWIDSSSKERVRQSIADLASRLPQHQLSEKSRQYLQNESSNVDEIIEGVLDWLSRPSNDQWLLVFDNVDREYGVPSEAPEAFNIREYFPTAEQGSILITSRLASLWELGADDLKLQPVDELQAKSILENTTGRPEEGFLKLVARLQGLPLALNQAGSYMRKTGTHVAEYIELYDQEWSRLMTKQHSSASRENPDCSILTTWTLSFNSLRSQNDAVANFLMLCSFLDGQDLWYELFKARLELAIPDEVPSWFVDCVGNEIDFNECKGLLLEYSFIDAKTKSPSFSIHSVLHSWCFHQCEEVMASMGRLAVMIVVSAATSEVVSESFLAERRLLPHCDHVRPTLQWLLQNVVQNEEHLGSLSVVCLSLVTLYEEQRKAEDAEKMCLLMLPGLEKFGGPDHKCMPGFANILGMVYLGQGKTKEAEESFLRALVEYQKYQGLNYAMAHGPLPILVILYSKQGRMKEAENMYLRSSTAREKIFGFEDLPTLDAVHSLGSFYMNQGRTKEAEDMFLRVLIGLEKAPSPDHRRLLSVIYDLGFLYSKDPCKMKEAEEMYLRALVGYKKIHDSEHIDVMMTERSLGNLYLKDPGKIKEAEEMYLRALAGYKKIHGSKHIDVMMTERSLGNLYSKDPCKMKEAEEMYLTALADYQKIYGPEDLNVLQISLALGDLYSTDQCKIKEAEEMYLGALVGYEQVCGPKHIDAVMTRHHLGSLYSKDPCKIKEAEKLYLGALVDYEKIYGPEHISVINTKHDLGIIYLKDPCKMKESEELLSRALDGFQMIYGSEHTLVMRMRYALGLLYYNHGRWKEAEGMYLSALDGFQHCSAHEDVFTTRNKLGMLFKEQSMFEEAVQQFELASEGYTNLLGSDDEMTIQTLEKLKDWLQQLEAEKETPSSISEDRHSVSESRRLSAP